MQSAIETLNRLGARAAEVAWPMLWQSSLLIAVMFLADWALRRWVRAAVRYALWWVVLLKLVLPPSLALPTSPIWWLSSSPPAPAPTATAVVHIGTSEMRSAMRTSPALVFAPPTERLSAAGAALAGAGSVSLVLLIWILVRWRNATRLVRGSAQPPAWLDAIVEENRRTVGLRRPVRLRLVDRTISPAVLGLFRPVILVPKTLVASLSHAQLRTVLLHELVHLRRADTWANCFQALLQTAYWWHPLLWLANARVRRLREEAVDDAVIAGSRVDVEAYASALLQVARAALQRPLATLALVGILESRSFLRQRIDRLLNMPSPRIAGLSFASVLSILAVGAFALPMGQPEPKPVSRAAPASSTTATASPALAEVGGGERPTTAEPLRFSPALREAVGGTKALTLSSGRRKTLDNLGSIRLTLSLDNVPLGLVVDQLTEVARSQSSGTKAIRFTITNTVESSGSGTTPASNPANILISINRMQDATLLSVVDAIVRSAHPSLKWTVVEDGVAFSTRQPDNPSQLFARIIKIDPQSFLTEVRRVFTSAPPGVSGDVQQTVRAFFSRSGLDLSPPKQVFFDEREGNLVIRGTLADLDAIENAIGNLGTGQEQIHIKAAFLEFSEELLARFWSSQGITNAAEAETLSILTPFQQRRAREFLNSNSGVHLLNEASVTTLSGRQTMIQLVDLMPVLTNINPRALSHPGVPANGEGTNALYLSDSRPCGPTLELLPDLRADGFNIQLGATTTTHEFLGYDKPTNSVAVFVEGKRQRVELPVPRFRSRSATAAAVVRDGQTLLLKGLSSENVTKYKDKVPVLGDLPLVGTLFRSESTKREKKHLLVMITPTLVDPAGNRLHTDEQVEKAAAIQRWRQEWLPE